MRINYQKNQMGMLAVVFSLMAITLYMAFAFPYSLLHFKQSETTELKAVIIIGRHGEVTPSKEAYFDAYGEEPPQAWFTLGGPDQLTSVGKERMYLLGKFLKLHYYERLLQGNPRRLYVRSESSDKTLESAQALLAGLNPPRDKWFWRHNADSSADSEFASSWQPKAIHTMPAAYDDLLSSQSKCLQVDSYRANWKNSTRYLQLINEFRHDLQILRQNTGLYFEDDLEMLANIEGHLRARSSFDSELKMPSWYTSTLAQRLAHIADVTAGCRFSQVSSQRLYVGRLLDTVVKNIFAKIRSDLTSGVSLLNNNDSNSESKDNDTTEDTNDSADSLANTNGRGDTFNSTNSTSKRDRTEATASSSRQQLTPTLTAVSVSKMLPPEEQIKLKLERQMEPSMFIYMTNKQHLTALLNSLKIYSSQPHYGALLMIELHYDPVNQVHFLRLFTVNSASHNVLPEPVRVNPIACLDTIECSPQQFEKNIRHLIVDKLTWQGLCSNIDQYENDQLLQPLTNPTTTTTTTTTSISGEPISLPTSAPLPGGLSGTSTNSPLDSSGDNNGNNTGVVSDDQDIGDGGFDDILGPTERSAPRPTSAPIGEMSTTKGTTSADDVNDSIHLDKLDESLVVGPTKTTTTTETNSDQTNEESGVSTTEQVAFESTTVPNSLDDNSKPTTTKSASNLEAGDSTTDTTVTKATTIATTTTDAGAVTSTNSGPSGTSSSEAVDEINPTTPIPTTTTAPTTIGSASTVGSDSVPENDLKDSEIIDKNYLLEDNYTNGENDD